MHIDRLTLSSCARAGDHPSKAGLGPGEGLSAPVSLDKDRSPVLLAYARWLCGKAPGAGDVEARCQALEPKLGLGRSARDHGASRASTALVKCPLGQPLA